MSYAKAGELLRLALDLSARHSGMTLSEIDQRWGGGTEAARRRTQRILSELQALFPDAYEDRTEPEGKTVWLRRGRIRDLSAIGARDVAALERSVTSARTVGDPGDVERLEKVLAVVRMLLPDKMRSRAETDIEAMLQSYHLAARPGPRPLQDRAVIEPISDALLAMKQVGFDYRGTGGVKRQVVHPYGLITGHRTYLVALTAKRMEGEPSLWRLDRMANVEMMSARSHVPQEFSLADHAKRAFGVFQNKDEYGEVVWRFLPDVAANARGFRFHPDQTIEESADGSLTVRFHAAGHLEMAWFLYQWGDKVEVVEPAALRALVEDHQRSDFPAAP
ncbi:YafY family protein [Aureimonas sp. AU20]|uniref:helix-turn-helix transcriptional regulator n=1 Tax=Aureimonas sp. AU20 TaxID=1349819 RepID=UPI00072029FD|nr:WYL domain-containing protein [Aureimonas sp. AU20]ALN72260.1 hypothetical protein M673_06000 [Aureimonas sp. AU20]